MLTWWCIPKDLMIPVDVIVLPLIRYLRAGSVVREEFNTERYWSDIRLMGLVWISDAIVCEGLIPRDVIDTSEGSIPMDVQDVNIESTEGQEQEGFYARMYKQKGCYKKAIKDEETTVGEDKVDKEEKVYAVVKEDEVQEFDEEDEVQEVDKEYESDEASRHEDASDEDASDEDASDEHESDED
ncbi:hypothetical protein Tco_1344207 [Tanacetum coccineum]